MIRQCAWCGEVLGEKEPLEDKRITHTICDDCDKKLREEDEADTDVYKCECGRQFSWKAGVDLCKAGNHGWKRIIQ